MKKCSDPGHTYEYLKRWLEDHPVESLLVMDAVRENHPDCLKLLIEASANPNITNFADETPVYWASEQGHYTCLMYLLGLENIDYGFSQMTCTSALEIAILNCHKECAFALIDRGLIFTKTHLHDREHIQ
jgi:hypothetical protein